MKRWKSAQIAVLEHSQMRKSCFFSHLWQRFLNAQMEFEKNKICFEYLLLEKRSFPGSFVNTFSGGCRGTLIKLGEFGKFHHIRSAPPYHGQLETDLLYRTGKLKLRLLYQVNWKSIPGNQILYQVNWKSAYYTRKINLLYQVDWKPVYYTRSAVQVNWIPATVPGKLKFGLEFCPSLLYLNRQPV